MEFTHELVKSGQIDIFGNPVYGNADRTRHFGFEADATIQASNELSISGNFTLSSNKIVRYSFIDSASGGVRYARNLDGNPIAGFPDVMGNLRINYQVGNLTTSLAAKYVGSFYTDNFKNADNKNDAYTLVNFESLYTLPKIMDTEIALRGEIRNVLNRLYLQTGEGAEFFPAAERNYLIGISATL